MEIKKEDIIDLILQNTDNINFLHTDINFSLIRDYCVEGQYTDFFELKIKRIFFYKIIKIAINYNLSNGYMKEYFIYSNDILINIPYYQKGFESQENLCKKLLEIKKRKEHFLQKQKAIEDEKNEKSQELFLKNKEQNVFKKIYKILI